MSTTLVLGGAGFIGSNLTPALLRSGRNVRVFARAGSDLSRLQPYRDDIDLRLGDFANEWALADAVTGVDEVIHLISTTVPSSPNNSVYYDVFSNLVPSARLIENCHRSGVQRLVFTSSGGTVYGEAEQLPIPEDHPRRPVSEYGLGKQMIEDVISHASRKHDLRSTILRVSNPYGEGQDPKGGQGIVAVAFGCALSGRPFVLRGDGTTVRDYLHIDDVVDAIVAGLKVEGDLIANVASGEGVSVNDMLANISKITGREITIDRHPQLTNDVQSNVLDNSRAREALSWNPSVGLSDGLARTWDWIEKTHPREPS